MQLILCHIIQPHCISLQTQSHEVWRVQGTQEGLHHTKQLSVAVQGHNVPFLSFGA